LTDDAELRARIEAQVAARRAEASASRPDRDVPGEQDDSGAPVRGPRALAPNRPWARSNPVQKDSAGAGSPDAAVRAASSGTDPRGLGPVRPWLARGGPAHQPATPAPPADPRPANGRLQPVRPWAHRPTERSDTSAVPTPSNQDIVLRDMAAEPEVAHVDEPSPAAEAAEPRQGPRALRWLLARGPESATPTEPAAEPEAVAPAAAAAYGADQGEAPAPGEDLARRLAAANAADAPDPPTSPEDANGHGRRSVVARLLGSKRAEDEDDEGYEQFDLPAPDAAFERPWLRTEPPAPTRSWPSQPVPMPEPSAASQAGQEPAAEITPQPERDVPIVATPTYSVPPVAPPPTPPTRPSPGPGTRRRAPAAATTHRPAPGPGIHRPTPAVPPATTTATSSGIAGATAPTAAPHRPEHAAAGTISGTTGTAERSSTVDLSRFLKKTEPPDDGGDGTKQEKPPHRWRRTLVRLLIIVAIAALAAFLLRTFVVQPYYIPSGSMEPTLMGGGGQTDDHVLVDKISYRTHSPREGDIVVFNRPSTWQISDKVLIKRVIGLPGDTVSLRDGHVFINGLELDEPYVNKACGAHPTQPLTNVTSWRVPGNDVFVMGDNRCQSDDSRQFGPVPESDIIGRAFAIIWPLNRIGLI
jgi:signal peptidase I, bacterial type